MAGYRSNSPASRLAWACAAVFLMGAVAWGAGQAVQRIRKGFVIVSGPEKPIEVRTPGGDTRFVGGRMVGIVVSDDPNVTGADVRRQSELIDRAKATGKATVVKSQETDIGTVVTYRATLDDGRIVTWAGSPEDAMTPEQRAERQKQLVTSLVAGRFEFVRKFKTQDGVTMYSYRVRLPDGTSVRHASLMPEHDPEKLKTYQQEIERAKGEHRGTLVGEVEPLELPNVPKGMEPPKFVRMYMYKVTLSDGDVSMYSTPDPPAKAGTE